MARKFGVPKWRPNLWRHRSVRHSPPPAKRLPSDDDASELQLPEGAELTAHETPALVEQYMALLFLAATSLIPFAEEATACQAALSEPLTDQVLPESMEV